MARTTVKIAQTAMTVLASIGNTPFQGCRPTSEAPQGILSDATRHALSRGRMSAVEVPVRTSAIIAQKTRERPSRTSWRAAAFLKTQPHALRGCESRMACTNLVRSTDSGMPYRDRPDRASPPLMARERACGARPGGRAAARKPSPGRGGEPSYLSAKPPCTRRESAVITVQRTAPCSPMSRKAAGEPFRRPLAPHSLPRGRAAAGKPFFRRPALASGRPAASGLPHRNVGARRDRDDRGMAVANRYSVPDSCRPCGSRTHAKRGAALLSQLSGYLRTCTVETVHPAAEHGGLEGACTPSTAGSFTAGGLLLLNPSEAGSDRRPPQPRRFFSAVRLLPYIRQLYGYSRTAVVRLFPYIRSNEKARGGRPGLRSLQARNRTISSPIVPMAHRRHRPNQP